MSAVATTSTDLAVLMNMANPNVYINTVRAIPDIDPESEAVCIERIQKHQCKESLQKLLLPHLKMVVNIAMKYAGSYYFNLHKADLIQAGNVGLIESVSKFKIDAENRFSSFAGYRVQSKVCDFILQNHNQLTGQHKTKYGRKLFFNYTAVQKIVKRHNGVATNDCIQEIMDTFDVNHQSVIHCLDQFNFSCRSLTPDGAIDFNGIDGSGDFDDNYTIDIESSSNSIEDYIELETETLQEDALYELMDEVLPERDADILMERRMYDTPSKLRELADKYGISTERVRQIEARAIKKLKAAAAELYPDLMCA